MDWDPKKMSPEFIALLIITAIIFITLLFGGELILKKLIEIIKIRIS